MKTYTCTCKQCRTKRRLTRVKKTNRIQTYQVRAARSRVRQILRTDGDIYSVSDRLPIAATTDYYA